MVGAGQDSVISEGQAADSQRIRDLERQVSVLADALSVLAATNVVPPGQVQRARGDYLVLVAHGLVDQLLKDAGLIE